MTTRSAHKWQLRFRRVPQLDNLELLHASGITHDYPPHMHEEHSIGIVLRGSETTISRGQSHTAHRGDLVLINAEEVHSNKSVASEYRLIKVRRQSLDRIACDLGIRPAPSYFSKIVVKDPLVFRQLLGLHLKLEQNVSALEQESAFVSTIDLLLARQAVTCRPQKSEPSIARDQDYVEVVREYLKSHYAENVSLSHLTSLTNLSSFHLLRIFHDRAGFPPHEYQTQVRIAHARKLIRDGVPLSVAAVETGFFDQSHLSRNFKRIVGVTPRQYFSA